MPVGLQRTHDAHFASGYFDVLVAPGPGNQTQGRDNLPAVFMLDKDQVLGPRGRVMVE